MAPVVDALSLIVDPTWVPDTFTVTAVVRPEKSTVLPGPLSMMVSLPVPTWKSLLVPSPVKVYEADPPSKTLGPDAEADVEPVTDVSPLMVSLSAPDSHETVPDVPAVRLTVTPVLMALKSIELPALLPPVALNV